MMIHFVCPGCGWQHSANPSFIGMTARCVRCGTVIRVDPDPDADEPTEGTDIGEADQQFELTDVGAEGTDLAADGTDMEGTDVEGTAVDPTDVEGAEEEEEEDQDSGKKKLYLIIGAVVVAILGLVAYLLFSGGPPTPPIEPPQTKQPQAVWGWGRSTREIRPATLASRPARATDRNDGHATPDGI